MKKLITILFAVALGLNLSAQTECSSPQDANQDGVIGVDDLMDLLSHWGDTDFDFDGVYDSVDLCTDEGACNYLSNPTEACLYLDAIGACGGYCVEDTDGDGVCDEFYGPCQGQSTVTYQDYTYDLVAIGEQCWFAENLRSEHYANGDAIPVPNGWWGSTTEGAQAVYNNDVSNVTNYGRLYNWYAVDDERGLCPTGWHVPTDGEFMTLEMALGMSEAEASSNGARGTDQGTQMKSSPSDNPSWNGTNSSGFSGLAGGRLNFVSLFNGGGIYGDFWSASASGTEAWYRRLYGEFNEVWRSSNNQGNGFSVRCVRD